tara:strand:+ start:199 stop:444 length:246 start_codon:yes stop_codon:yes gene_type:complete
MALHDILGTIGVAFIVVMYVMLQLGKINAERPAFSAFNALGAAFILVSLTYEFNLSAALMEGVWLLVSLCGLWKALSGRRP